MSSPTPTDTQEDEGHGKTWWRHRKVGLATSLADQNSAALTIDQDSAASSAKQDLVASSAEQHSAASSA